MKITIDVDCTPDEARAFFGLPDVKPMQEAALAAIQERLEAALAAQDVEALMKAWMPPGIAGIDNLQKAFWSAASGAKTKDAKTKGD